MKQIITIFTVAFLLAISALAKDCYIADSGVTISVPDEYTTIERDKALMSLDGEDVVKSVDWVNDYLDDVGAELSAASIDNNIYIYAFSLNEYENRSEANIYFDLQLSRDALIEEFFEGMENEFREYEDAEGVELVRGEDIKIEEAFFFKLYKYMDGELDTIYYSTIKRGREVSFVALFKDGHTAELEAEIDEIIKSIRFDDTLEKLQAAELDKVKGYYPGMYDFGKIEEMEREREKIRKSIKQAKGWVFSFFAIALVVVFVLVFLFYRKRRENEARDAALSAKATCTCRACGEPIGEGTKICPSCGTRQ